MSVLVEFSVVPIGKGVSMSSQIAEVLRIVDASGVSYRINPMGTVLEGGWDEVMNVVRKCHEAVRRDAERVYTTVKIDDRKDGENRIDGKVDSVEKKAGIKLRK